MHQSNEGFHRLELTIIQDGSSIAFETVTQIITATRITFGDRLSRSNDKTLARLYLRWRDLDRTFQVRRLSFWEARTQGASNDELLKMITDSLERQASTIIERLFELPLSKKSRDELKIFNKNLPNQVEAWRVLYAKNLQYILENEKHFKVEGRYPT